MKFSDQYIAAQQQQRQRAGSAKPSVTGDGKEPVKLRLWRQVVASVEAFAIANLASSDTVVPTDMILDQIFLAEILMKKKLKALEEMKMIYPNGQLDAAMDAVGQAADSLKAFKPVLVALETAMKNAAAKEGAYVKSLSA
jgi:hypothetical protein